MGRELFAKRGFETRTVFPPPPLLFLFFPNFTNFADLRRYNIAFVFDLLIEFWGSSILVHEEMRLHHIMKSDMEMADLGMRKFPILLPPKYLFFSSIQNRRSLFSRLFHVPPCLHYQHVEKSRKPSSTLCRRGKGGKLCLLKSSLGVHVRGGESRKV